MLTIIKGWWLPIGAAQGRKAKTAMQQTDLLVPPQSDFSKAAAALAKLERLVAAVKRPGENNSEYDAVLEVLKTLSRKEGIPIAIIGGLAAIHYGYERYTNDVDVVIASQYGDTFLRVAPRYGIKVIWHDPQGWHKLEYAGVRVEIVPEGGKPNKHAPTTIPSPRQLGVTEGLSYASLAGWMETKLSSGRQQDKADVVQVLKKTDPEAIGQARAHLGQVHAQYLCLFEELVTAAEEEKVQESERGGPR